MKRFVFLGAVIVCLLVSAAFGAGTYDGGDGTAEAPYQIATAGHLHELSLHSEDWGKYFVLTADIDMDPAVTGIPAFSSAMIAPDTGNNIYSFSGPYFAGVFDGNGHVISNLTIDTAGEGTDYLGLFGKVNGSIAEIKNLGLVNVEIIAGDYSSYIGGLCAINYGSISNCYSVGQLSGENGFTNIGGLCGENFGVISKCYATGYVTGGNHSGNLGGLCGINYWHGVIENCYATSSVNAGDESGRLGGLCGDNFDYGSISNCYSIGPVTYGYDCLSPGGLSGRNRGTITDCYFYLFSGPDHIYGIDLDDLQLQDQLSFSGFDFAGNPDDGIDDVWVIENGRCPKLSWQTGDGPLPPDYRPVTSLAGRGYSYDPFQINSYEDLIEFRSNDDLHHGYYILNSDFDLSSEVFTTAVIDRYFSGHLDGNGHVISNITIDADGSGNSYLGMFSRLMGGSISYLGIENINIADHNDFEYLDFEYLGGLCGRNHYGSISNCYVSGSITSGAEFRIIGGLCGENYCGSISNSYSTCAIFGDHSSGGLCGSNSGGSISKCYAASSVSTESSFNHYGLCVYSNGGEVDNSYFYLFSGLDNHIGTDLDDLQMQDKASFAGFDFAGNSEDGDDDHWTMESERCPKLSWQTDEGPVVSNLPVTKFAGSGRSSDPFQINSYDDFTEFRSNTSPNYGYFILNTDLDLSEETFAESVVNKDFGGHFDGNGHIISNLTIDSPEADEIGLFGRLCGEITRLGLVNASITGGHRVGGLVGTCNGKISQCFSSGVVNGDSLIGGLVGIANHNENISISDCYSTADVNCTEYEVGGLVGRADNGEITRCYSTGVVNGPDDISTCGFFSTYLGKYYSANGCFWDVETSGMTTTSMEKYGVAGFGTDSMKNSRFYSYCNWPGDVWTIDEGNDYPRLAWENKPGLPMPESAGLKGEGTAEEPYKIETVEDLQIVSFDRLLWGDHFVLAADLDLEGVLMTCIGDLASREYGGNTSSYKYNGFSGSFDGGGHIISNLSLNFPDRSDVGFFSGIYDDGEVKNLGLEDVKVNGYGHVGGLVGCSKGNISQCYVTGEVNGNTYVGGFVGGNLGYFITDCYCTASVNGGSTVGGFTGVYQDAYRGLDRNISASVRRCYCAGSVSGDTFVGGFSGNSASALSLENCFFDSSSNPGLEAGINNSDLSGVFGRPTGEMQSMATFSFGGWGGDVWTINEGEDYPRLAWENAGGENIRSVGSGTEDDPVRISNAFDLYILNYNDSFYKECFLLTADIDMDPAVTGYPVFTKPFLGSFGYDDFEGKFDGGGHVISNLVIDTESYGGFFGTISECASIVDLGLENITVSGKHKVGALAGFCGDRYWPDKYKTISRCYSTGSVSGTGNVGGLLGYIDSTDVSDCYSSCSVNSDETCGGLVATVTDSSTINRCYSTGLIGEGEYPGGLIRYVSSGSILDSYWDVESSGFGVAGDDNFGAIGKSTSGMKLSSTYASWDFVGESVNGDEDVWRLCVDGSGYPRLAWEYSQKRDFVCGDGVDMSDLAYFAGRYGADVDIEYADLDGDGVVGVLDLCIFASHWLE